MPERHHVTAKTPINLSIAGISWEDVWNLLIPGFVDKVLLLVLLPFVVGLPPSNRGPLE